MVLQPHTMSYFLVNTTRNSPCWNKLRQQQVCQF